MAQATFTDTDSGLALSLSATGLSAGFHGLHAHANGACDAPDFTSAGSHFDGQPGEMSMSSDAPTAMPQGHAGDLPSLLVNHNGTGELAAVTDRFSVADLLAGARTALIIHAGPDGDAGARLACGVIEQQFG